MDSYKSFLFQDWEINRETSFKSRFSLVLFRSAQYPKKPTSQHLFMKPFRAIYQILVEWILGIEIPWDTDIGHSLQLQHGHGLVINHEVTIGHNCVLRHTANIYIISNGWCI